MSRQSLSQLFERVRATPWRFGFIALLRRLQAGQGTEVRIGHALRPRQESFRLGQSADLAFAPREIAEVALPAMQAEVPFAARRALPGNRPDLPLLRLFGLGLLGPNGPLPLHYTQWVRDRSHNHHDGTLANFLDVFHHRYLTLFYRTWAQGQAAAGLDRPHDETFSAYVARLTGHDPLEIRDSVLPAHARLSASAHLSQGSRHPDGLAQTLTHYFRAPVRVEEFVLHWIDIDADDHSRLGRRHGSSILGEGAVAGETIPDRQSKFRLVMGPLDIGRYLRFTPDGPDLPKLVAWVRAFVGHEYVWELELRVLAAGAPSARLQEGPRLGWSTWLGDAAWGPLHQGVDLPDHAVGLVFEPELCAARPGNPSDATSTATLHS